VELKSSTHRLLCAILTAILEDADAWSSELIDYTENAGGPGRTRTYNQQIMSLLL
jgi:hypothetical protein